jgi:hypothetical protein
MLLLIASILTAVHAERGEMLQIGHFLLRNGMRRITIVEEQGLYHYQ